MELTSIQLFPQDSLHLQDQHHRHIVLHLLDNSDKYVKQQTLKKSYLFTLVFRGL